MASREVLLGQIELPEAEVDPAQRVDVRAVVRLLAHGAREHLLRAVEIHAVLGPHIAEVIERRRVLRILLQHLEEHCLRGLAVAGALVHRAELELQIDARPAWR